MTINVEVDTKPLKTALAQAMENRRTSPDTLKELFSACHGVPGELVRLEFIPMPGSAACRVVMKPGKQLLDLIAGLEPPA